MPIFFSFCRPAPSFYKHRYFLRETGFTQISGRKSVCGMKTSMIISESSSSSDFANRIEQAWLISQQPKPTACTACNSRGTIECKWCAGTGFFILGDNMLCQVPSKNTSCIICSQKGYISCSDCKGTGLRAKWLEKLSQTER